MDAISLMAFGLKTDSLNDTHNQFVEMAKKGFRALLSSTQIPITRMDSFAFKLKLIIYVPTRVVLVPWTIGPYCCSIGIDI